MAHVCKVRYRACGLTLMIQSKLQQRLCHRTEIFRRWNVWMTICLIVLSVSRLYAQDTQLPIYKIEAIEVRGNQKTTSSLIRSTLLFSVGELLSVDDPKFELSRLRVLSLGYFSEVQLRLAKGAERGKVRVIVEVKERGTLIITDIFLGTSEATDIWGGFGAAERNFLGEGRSIEAAFVLGQSDVDEGHLQGSGWLRISVPRLGGGPLELSLSGTFLNGNEFFRRSGPDSSADPVNFLSINYRRIGGTIGLGLNLWRFTRFFIDYRGEVVHSSLPRGAVRTHPNSITEPIEFGILDGSSRLSNIAISFDHDTRTDPVLPSAGTHLNVSAETSTRLLGSSYNYMTLKASVQHFVSMKWGHVFSLQLFGGVVFGDAPFFEKFFIGDFNDLLPNRALGLNFSTLPSRNFFDTSIDSKWYEEIAVRTSVEYAIPWFRGGTWFYGGDFFINTGLIFLTSIHEIAVRDRSFPSAFPIDLTFDLGLRLDTQIGIFRLSVGNALGRIPF